MVEWVPIIVILIIIPVTWLMIKLSWNLAQGGMDLMQLLGNAGKAGTTRQQSNDEINDRKKKHFKGKNKKWGYNGKIK